MSGLRGRESKSRAGRISRSQHNSIKKAQAAGAIDPIQDLAGALDNLDHSDGDSDGEHSGAEIDWDDRRLDSIADQAALVDVAEIVDQLGERSMATRVQALRQLAAFLRAGPAPSSLSSHVETLELHLSNNLKRGLAEELPDVCDVISVLSYSFGEDDGDFLLPAFLPWLTRTVANWNQENDARIAALGALGSLLLILGSEEQTETGLRLCESIFAQAHGVKKGIVVPMKDRHPSLLVQALRVWGVLASSLSPARLAGAVCARYLSLFGDLLDHERSGVRLEAGQNLALLHEAVQEAPDPDYSPLAGGEDEGQQQPAAAVGKRPSFRQFLDRLRELAEGFDRQQAKQARREERAGFRAIVRSLEGRPNEDSSDERPSESLVYGKSRVVISGWRELRRYHFVRTALAGGFLVHLRGGGCGIVPALLELDMDALEGEEGGVAGEASWDAKAARQERFRREAKEAGLARDKHRRKKQQMQGVFAGDD